MGEFVTVIALPHREVYCSLEPMGDAEAFNALSMKKFGALSACLQAFNTFIQWTDGVQPNLGAALGKIIKLIDRFPAMEKDRNEYIETCGAVFFQRILITADLAQQMLGFLVTPYGFGWYRRLPDAVVARVGFLLEATPPERRRCDGRRSYLGPPTAFGTRWGMGVGDAVLGARVSSHDPR
jgi:hypothetical protein